MPRNATGRSSDFVFGADLGQAQDPTALAVTELVGQELQLRHLDSLPLGLSYPAVVERIGALKRALPGPADLVVDATGVGRPVLDMLRAAGLDPVPVTFTGGRKAKFVDGMWRVPKRVLVRSLVSALEGGRLKVAHGLRLAEAFRDELRAFERRVSSRGHDTYNGVGEHDDLIIAVALTCWWVGCPANARGVSETAARPH